jgi:hypothetical protein
MSHTAHTHRIGPDNYATRRSAVRAPAYSGRVVDYQRGNYQEAGFCKNEAMRRHPVIPIELTFE